jgi:hypothetical protein
MKPSTLTPEALLQWLKSDHITSWFDVERPLQLCLTAHRPRSAAQDEVVAFDSAHAALFEAAVAQVFENMTGHALTRRVARQSYLHGKEKAQLLAPSAAELAVLARTNFVNLATAPEPGRAAPINQLRELAEATAFESVDAKAAYALRGVHGSFRDWIKASDPATYSFWLVRLASVDDVMPEYDALACLRDYQNDVGIMLDTWALLAKDRRDANSWSAYNLRSALNDMAGKLLARASVQPASAPI